MHGSWNVEARASHEGELELICSIGRLIKGLWRFRRVGVKFACFGFLISCEVRTWLFAKFA